MLHGTVFQRITSYEFYKDRAEEAVDLGPHKPVGEHRSACV